MWYLKNILPQCIYWNILLFYDVNVISSSMFYLHRFWDHILESFERNCKSTPIMAFISQNYPSPKLYKYIGSVIKDG